MTHAWKPGDRAMVKLGEARMFDVNGQKHFKIAVYSDLLLPESALHPLPPGMTDEEHEVLGKAIMFRRRCGDNFSVNELIKAVDALIASRKPPTPREALLSALRADPTAVAKFGHLIEAMEKEAET